MEFVATHRPSGQEIAVEAKNRHRTGVLNEEGEPDEDDPLRGDARAVRRLFMSAIEKAPEGMPFMIFIDINAPLEPDAEGLDKEWVQDIRKWMDRFPAPTAEQPEAYNALYVTNFSPHYQGDDLARGGEWLAVRPLFTLNPTAFDLTGMLDHALNNCLKLRPDRARLGEPLQAAKLALRSLARRIRDLDHEIAELDTQLEQLVPVAAPRTIRLLGVGVVHASQLLVTAGQNIDRLRSETAFAKICAAAGSRERRAVPLAPEIARHT